MNTEPTTTPKPRRRWLQFSLRTMLILMLVISVPLGWFTYRLNQARKQRAVIDAIHALGGSTEYDGESGSYTEGSYPSMAFGLDSLGFPDPPGCPAPVWLRRCLGDDFFVRIVGVRGDSDDVLERAARLPHLSSLSVGPLHRNPYASYPVTDAGLEHLKESSQLRTVMLNQTRVTDAGLIHLSWLIQLQHLDLSGTQVTDAGLTHLRGLTQLQYLNLSGTQVTAARVAELKGTLPKCEILR